MRGLPGSCPGAGDAPGRSLLLTHASAAPAGPHVWPPLLHPLSGELLHHSPRRPPEVSEQEHRHEAELKGGSVGARTVSPHRPHLPSPCPRCRPDSGVSPFLEAWVWDRARGLLANRPPVHCSAGSVPESRAPCNSCPVCLPPPGERGAWHSCSLSLCPGDIDWDGSPGSSPALLALPTPLRAGGSPGVPGLHQLPWDKAGSRADGCLLHSSWGGQGSPPSLPSAAARAAPAR